MALNIENARFQVYKAKFVNGEANRRRLFADLRDCNTKLRGKCFVILSPSHH